MTTCNTHTITVNTMMMMEKHTFKPGCGSQAILYKIFGFPFRYSIHAFVVRIPENTIANKKPIRFSQMKIHCMPL